MQLPIKVERKRGFFSSLGTPESLYHLPAFLEDPQLSEMQSGTTFAPYLIESQGKFRDLALVKSLREMFTYYDAKPIPGSDERALIKIAVNELHCPRVPGVKAKLTVRQVREEKIACSVKILGVGGGDEFVATLTTSETLETENNCVAMTHLIPAVFEKCRMNTPDKGHIEFFRLKEVELTEDVKGESLNPDACQTASPQNPGSERVTYDFLDFPRSSYTKNLEIAAGFTWASEANVILEKVGLEIGAKYEATNTYSTELEYSLIEGYKYHAIKPPDSATWLWAWAGRTTS